MSRFHASVAIALCAVLVVACDDPPPEKLPPLSARVELASGDVWLVTEKAKSRLITGAMLPEKAELTVGDGSRALLRLGNGTGVFLRGGAVASIGAGQIELKKGELWADIPADERALGRFVAGGVTVAAADTGVDLKLAGGEVTVYVARGLAVVEAPGGRAEIEDGEQALVKGKAAPQVSPVAFWEDWTGGMADRELLAGIGGKAAGRIYGINRDRPGSPPEELQIAAQAVRIFVRDGVAHTTVDQRFFNPSSEPLEGWYWFSVPEDAAVERFAMEVNGALVDGEMIERKQAAAAYEAAVEARVFDPALLEWVDGRTFRARIFPIPGAGERRVVLSYIQLLPLADGVYRYVYPMGGGEETQIQEFSLEVDLGDEGKEMEISTLEDARIEQDRTRVTMRRSGFTPRSDFLLEMRPEEEREPMRAMRFSSGRDEADYVMLRYAPEVEWGKVQEVPGDVVVVLDTSAGGDDADRRVRTDAVEAILRALSAGDHFAVLSADLVPRVLYPEKGLAPAEEKHVAAAMERIADVASAGATDLGAMFGAALGLVHEAVQPAVVYVGDGLATVGETTPDELAERLRRTLGDSRARVFTIAVGADADTALLERIARVGGGRSFRIDTAEQAVQEALRFAGMVKTPTITDLVIDVGAGLDQVFSTVAGKVTEGEEVVLFARTHHALPNRIKVKGRLGGEAFEKAYDTEVEKGAGMGYIPALWARAYLERLMGEGLTAKRGTVISLGLSYGLMTPFTSFLVLESDAAYMMQGIQRRPRYLRVSELGEARDGVEIAKAAAEIPLGLFGCSEMQAGSAPEQEVSEDRVRQMLPSTPASGPSGVASQTGTAAPSPTDMPVAAAPSMPRRESAKKGGADELDDLLGGGKMDQAERKPMEEGAMGRDMSGEATGTIGLGLLGAIGSGAGGGGTGAGYGRGGGGAMASAPKVKRDEASMGRRLATEKPEPATASQKDTQIAVGNPYAVIKTN
ncbi:MAG: VWA domain-containing protein, partial [Proteobacteria bacterium]|nr:VWA domain-containing protein [Pseudomonadota bacterium]